jgi:transposase
MMGRLNHDQKQFFYSFRLDDAVPDEHPLREIAAVLDLSWLHAELAPYYPQLGRPSIDPVLMIRMLVIGYVFAIRSERALCRDVQVTAGCRLKTGYQIIRRSRVHATNASATAVSFGVCLSALSARALRRAWLAQRASQWMPA